jgi:Xaa-Pro aminopeptidase
MAPAAQWSETYAGLSATAKLKAVAGDLSEAEEDATLLTQPDSICWLLNLRGGDVGHTPLLHAMAVLHRSGTLDLYVEAEKLAAVTLPTGVTVRDPAALTDDLAAFTGKIRVDQSSAPQALLDALGTGKAEPTTGSDPCLLRKARKHPAEIAATTEAHLRDGAAVARFLRWFDETRRGESDRDRRGPRARRVPRGHRRAEGHQLRHDRGRGSPWRHRPLPRDGRNQRPRPAGPAVPHRLGAQYEDGTTDITRTLPVGEVGEAETTAFTQVLKGMIAIHRARFPKGVAGAHLDALARAPLWAAGRDYDHGTGHGVGVYLGVHEGPQRLSRVSTLPLEPGMILSNEPGYYREGAFGIRIENLIVVAEAPRLPDGDARDMLHFETLTWAPIDRRLVRTELMSGEERAWLDSYHAGVAERIRPRVDDDTARWLDRATAPI